ncbi:MAG: response regulator [Candidatus Pacebacteria bacterium]|jgi:DNA-binding response OmpR family regulator|nr:response regulator [Candidatus Paceibacterota bacterium]
MAKKILVIEDEATLQNAMVEVLEQSGYEAISALDGELGFALATKELPDLILLDIILPKMDGFEVLKGLKANPQTENIPIIILTNLGDVSSVQQALELGANSYLVKADFHLDDVIQKVERTLAG